MGLVYSCGTEIRERDKQEVDRCARQLALRHKFLAAKRAETLIKMSDLRTRNAPKAQLVAILGRMKSLDAQIAKITACHAMFESMKEATDTTNLLTTVRDHLQKTTEGGGTIPDPDTIYDIQDTLEIASDALRDTNEALGSQWKLEAYTQEGAESLEAELQTYLSPESSDPPSGPNSQSLDAISESQPNTSVQQESKRPLRTIAETEEPPFAPPSAPSTQPTSQDMPPSSTSSSMASKQQPKLSSYA